MQRIANELDWNEDETNISVDIFGNQTDKNVVNQNVKHIIETAGDIVEKSLLNINGQVDLVSTN